MKRLFLAAICVYAPHMLEEYVTHIWDDSFIATALAPCATWSPQHALYCAFQVTFALLCMTTLAFSYVGRPRNVVMAGFAFALLAESHHVVRFLISPHYNSGLYTALPMPVVGFLILKNLLSKEEIACSTTSSSPWASGESPSA